jgi:hypothetical protein
LVYWVIGIAPHELVGHDNDDNNRDDLDAHSDVFDLTKVTHDEKARTPADCWTALHGANQERWPRSSVN